MKERLTFRAKVRHGSGDQITLGDLDITNHVAAFQVKASSDQPTSVILKLVLVPLDLDLEANVEMNEVQP